jgi:hypothetical protein
MVEIPASVIVLLFSIVPRTGFTAMSENPKPMDELLFEAVHVHSLRTRGQPATRVTLHYTDGSEIILPVPARAIAVQVAAPESVQSWPPPDGWAFRPGEAAFNGIRMKLCGKLLAMLKELAAHPGEPVTSDRLKKVVWGEDPDDVEDGNLQGHVSLLRKRVRECLGLGDMNPITHADGAYRLAVY